MNISVAFNVRGLTPDIEDEDESNEDLRAIPLQGGKVDVEQPVRLNLLNTSKAFIQIESMMTFGTRA